MSKNNHGKRMVPEYLIAKLETLEPGGEYTAGDNITIEDGVISATDTTYTAGPGIEITNDNLVRTKVSINGGLSYNNDGNMIVDNSVVAFKSDIVDVTPNSTATPTATLTNLQVGTVTYEVPTPSYPVTDVEVNGVSALTGTVAQITVPTVATSTSTFSPTFETLTFTYSDQTTGTITFVTAGTVTTTTTLS